MKKTLRLFLSNNVPLSYFANMDENAINFELQPTSTMLFRGENSIYIYTCEISVSRKTILLCISVSFWLYETFYIWYIQGNSRKEGREWGYRNYIAGKFAKFKKIRIVITTTAIWFELIFEPYYSGKISNLRSLMIFKVTNKATCLLK